MKCFVIMPFGQEGTPEATRWLAIFKEVIRPAVVKSGLVVEQDCVRVDLIDKQGDILGDIIEGLHKSDLVIADLSARNPNVFYELGARHILRRGTILITQSRDDVPFHLLTERVAIYSYPEGALPQKEFESKIAALIQAISKDPDAPDSPFSEAIPFVGRTYARANLVLEIIVTKDADSPAQHIYTAQVVIKNTGHRKVTDFFWEIYWPADIPIKQRGRYLTAQGNDPAKPRYQKFRYQTEQGVLHSGLESTVTLTQFSVDVGVDESGVLDQPLLLKVYADGEPPIEKEFQLRGPKGKGVCF